MTIRTKLLLALASMVLLVVVQGLLDLRYASETRTDVDQLGKVVVSGSSAALGMMDALSELEVCLTATDNVDAIPVDTLRIRFQGEKSFQEFHRYLNDALQAARSGANISPAGRKISGADAKPGQLASLKGIEETLSVVQLKWQGFTNSLATSPGQARSIRDHFLLPVLNKSCVRRSPIFARVWIAIRCGGCNTCFNNPNGRSR